MRLARRDLLVGGVLAALNVSICLAFYISRPADDAFFRHQDEMGRNFTIDINSADPAHFAERPVYKAPFHGSEAWWVRAHLMAGLPSLVLAFGVERLAAWALADRWISLGRLGGLLRLESWVLGLSYLLTSTVQWFLVGFVVSVLARRIRAGPREAT